MNDHSRTVFAIRLAEALHRFGTPTHRLEETMAHVMERIGLTGRFFSVPTGIFASVGPPEDLNTGLIRVTTADVDLEKLCDLDELGDAVIAGEVDVADGSRRVDLIVGRPARWRSAHQLAAFALSSAAAARFFGGGWRDVVVSSCVGLIVGVVVTETTRRVATRQISTIVAALMASALAAVATEYLVPISIYTTTLAGLIMLVPGLTLTTAITELATGNLVSGTSRLIGGGLTFLELGFGVALGSAVSRTFAIPSPLTSESLPEWTLWVALLVAPVGFTVILRARPRDLGWLAMGSALGFGGARIGSIVLGPELGALLGAVSLGVGANLFARYRHRPAAVMLLPGLILLVPGSIGFTSLSRFIAHDVMSGVGAAFSVALVATAIATGLLVANALVPPGRNL